MNGHDFPSEEAQNAILDILDGIFSMEDSYAALSAAGTLISLAETHGSYPISSPTTPDIDDVEDVLFRMKSSKADLVLAVMDRIRDPSPLSEFQRRLIGRRTPLPAWVGRLDDLTPTKAAAIGPVTGELRTIAVHLQGLGDPLTFVVDILYSGVAMIADGYAFPGPLSDLTTSMEARDSDRWEIGEISLADARAEIEEALNLTERYLDPPQTHTWPATKPLLRWAMRFLPEGGAAPSTDFLEQPEEYIDAQVAAFMASEYANGLGRHTEDRAHFLLDLANNYGSGDIRNWSAQLVERVLLDLIPRKTLAGPDYLRPFPKVLGALVRYYHDLTGVPPIVTEDTLAAIASSRREFNRLIKPDHHDSSFYDVLWIGDDWEKDIGGSDKLDSVNVEPLPVEKFNPRGLRREVAKHARAVAREIERVAPQFFEDPEMTTSALRILRKLCEDSPEYFRSKSTAGSTGPVPWETSVAAAICWLAAKGNNWFIRSDPKRTVKAMTAAFGLKSFPSGRGDTIGSRILSAQLGEDRWHLGDPSLLTSTRRAHILRESEIRDHYW